MKEQNNILISKLDEFIRRYYKNQLLRGAIYSTGILLGAFLSVTLTEYFGHFGSGIRAFLFFGFLASALFVIAKYVVRPLLKLNRIGGVISYEQAASIIGQHFGSVQDKLLNVLQLQNNRLMSGSEELLLASIRQKTEELRPVPFTSAIDLNENRRYLPFVLPIVFTTFILAIVWPNIFSKSATRLVNYQTYYEKEMPFTFSFKNKSLQALQTEDYVLEVKVGGNQIPDEVYLHVNGIEYRLEKDDNFNFRHRFTNLQNTTVFQLGAAGFLSKEYTLKVLPKPLLVQFSVRLDYPAYLHKTSEEIANTGDLQVPEGTKVSWLFNTRNTDQLSMSFADSSAKSEKRGENNFAFSRKFNHDNRYSLKVSNSLVSGHDSVSYVVSVIKDQYPTIDVSEKPDSLEIKNIYFSGMVRDDYGLTQLNFFFKKLSSDSTGKEVESSGSVPLSLNKNAVSQPYYYFLDASQFNLQPGDRLEYYFEIKDNDGVNGAKAARTRMMSFHAPTRAEISENVNKSNTEIKKDLEESIKKARQLQKDVNELSKKINDKKQLGYEEKKKLEDLLKKQNELQNKIEEIKKENELNNKQQNEFSQTDESILEKQKELEQLFENVMTPEMKKLFDELNKMLEKLDKNQVQEKLEELKLSNKDIEKELDRNLEAFKQLEVEQKMQEAIDRLDELKKKQDELNKETTGKKEDKAKEDKPKEDKPGTEKNEKAADKQEKSAENKETPGNKEENKKDQKLSTPELEKKQDALNKEFEDLKKSLKDLEEKNKNLEEPNKMPDTQKKSDEISQDMKNSSQQLKENSKKAASKSQQSASDKMEQMKEEMEEAMEEEEEQQEEENAQALRQILENLVNLSYAQEALIRELPKTKVDNPQFITIPKQQNKLKDDSKIIEDSLLALSKRAPKVSAMVNREISSINQNMEKTVKALADRNIGESTMRMQSTMTSVNNLALLLNESLEQMQQQLKEQKESKAKKGGKCKKPGSGSGKKPSDKGNSAASMRKLQEQLNKQLQDLKDALEKGQKPGEKPGDKKAQQPGEGQNMNGRNPGNSNMPGSSEQFAKLAAQQEALRRQMHSMMEKLKSKGKNPGGDLANLMEETEKELVNKQLTNSTLKRQQEILSRLLESEKAEKEREQDEQRKSNEAKNENLSNPGQFLEYKRIKEKEMELLNTVPPTLTPYYKEKVNQYFNNLNK